jgi:ferredoxin-NADP reductase
MSAFIVDAGSVRETELVSEPGAAASLRVVRRELVARDVMSLTFADPWGRRLPSWTPGSHVDVILPNGMTRQYSLCGDRWDPYHYTVSILRQPNGRGGSEWLHTHISEGDVLEYGGPRNHFHMVPAESYLFIAGGIGITPLLPMIDQAVRGGKSWRLLYGGRNRESMAFRERLERHTEQVHIAPEDESGRLDLGHWISQIAPGTKVYACGPAGMLQAAEAASVQCPSYTLHTEKFEASAHASTQNRPFVVRLRRSGLEFDVQPGTSILDALSGAGTGILSSCRQGVCGTCEVPVLEGVPDHRDSVLDEADRQAGDCLIACVSRAKTDYITLDL